ncbi:MAG TPA: phage integrase N-terminal SAM-like domain-containing protein [Verrucomicrobiae bacterium]|nr:phage integrase N-terminal SAM-like domain-containing protein [Verrucomicrobiae bacterium]
MLVRLSGRLIFAIPFNRKWFLINPTCSINTTAGSVNQSKIPQSSNEKLEQFLTDLACRHHVSASTQNQALNAILRNSVTLPKKRF